MEIQAVLMFLQAEAELCIQAQLRESQRLAQETRLRQGHRLRQRERHRLQIRQVHKENHRQFQIHRRQEVLQIVLRQGVHRQVVQARLQAARGRAAEEDK